MFLLLILHLLENVNNIKRNKSSSMLFKSHCRKILFFSTCCVKSSCSPLIFAFKLVNNSSLLSHLDIFLIINIHLIFTKVPKLCFQLFYIRKMVWNFRQHLSKIVLHRVAFLVKCLVWHCQYSPLALCASL